MLQRFVRRRLNALRRAFGRDALGAGLHRSRRARLSVRQPGFLIPPFLPDSPQELALPPELRDARLLADAIAWSHGMGERHAAARPAPREVTAKGQMPAKSRSTRNVLLISHCDFTGNSALHTYRDCAGAPHRGYSPVIAVPGDPETVEDLGRPPFAVGSWETAALRTSSASRTAPWIRPWSTRSLRANEFASSPLRSSRRWRCPYARFTWRTTIEPFSQPRSKRRVEGLRAAPGAGAG